MAANVAASRRRGAASIATLVLYVGAVVVLTWPLAAHLASHRPHAIPGMRMDSLYSVWAAAWATHALSTTPLTLPDANAYYPARNVFFYGPHGLGLVPYFGPTFLVTGNPTLAANLAFLGCVALTAWGLHRVVVRWTESEPSGLVAGMTFLTTPWVLWAWIPAVLHWATLLYFPWVIALAASRTATGRQLALLGMLVVLQCLTDPVFVTPAVLVPLAAIAVARLLDRNTRPRGVRDSTVLAAAVLALLPLYAGYASVLGAEQGLSERRAWSRSVPEWLAPLEPVVIADRLMLPLTLPWGRSNNFSPLGVPQVVLPLIGIGLASVLAGGERPHRPRRAWVHSSAWVALGIIVSVPAVRIWNSTPIRSPFFLVAERVAPQLIHLVNSPDRLGVAALMGLALLSGLAFAECDRRMGRRLSWLIAVAIIGLMTAEWCSRVQLPYPLFEPPAVPPAILTRLREASGPVLELPVTQDRGWHSLAMYRSIYHWRPILNGYTSYWPRGFEERMALAKRLPDPLSLELLHQQTGLAAVLVDTSILPARNPWSALADSPSASALRLVAKDRDMLLFSVGDPATTAGAR